MTIRNDFGGTEPKKEPYTLREQMEIYKLAVQVQSGEEKAAALASEMEKMDLETPSQDVLSNAANLLAQYTQGFRLHMPGVGTIRQAVDKTYGASFMFSADDKKLKAPFSWSVPRP